VAVSSVRSDPGWDNRQGHCRGEHEEYGGRCVGIPGRDTVDLGHTAASLAISSGANAKPVQTVLGHVSAVLTSDTYAI